MMKLVFSLLFLVLLAPVIEGCHTGQEGKRKKRQTDVSEAEDSQVWRDYFAACLKVQAPDPSYDWQSNVDFTILDTNWYLGTKNVLCSAESGYDSENCWSQEIAEYVADDDLLPKIQKCIKEYFEDISHDPPVYSYTLRQKRAVSPYPPPTYTLPPYPPPTYTLPPQYPPGDATPPRPYGNINFQYAQCLQGGSSNLKYPQLLSAIQKHTVVRKCDRALVKRPITYAQRFLFLARPDSDVYKNIRACNLRHFPAENFYSIWTPWSECKPTCNGHRTRKRFCHNGDNPSVRLPASQCKGQGPSSQRKKCSSPRCWAKWTRWSSCSKTCATGTRTRRRICLSNFLPYSTGGNCVGKRTQKAYCNIDVKCILPCTYGQIHYNCAPCGRECQFIDFPPPCALGCRPGCACPRGLYWNNDKTKCMTRQECKAPVGVWTRWSSWTNCVPGANECFGTRTRSRRCVVGNRQVKKSLCTGKSDVKQSCIACLFAFSRTSGSSSVFSSSSSSSSSSSTSG